MVVAEEKTDVENTILLKEKLKADNLQITLEEEWNALAEHVDVHKYLMGENGTVFASWEEAFDSWHDTVYAPILNVIEWWEVKNAFATYTRGQLYFAVSTHWFYMIEKNPETTPEEAAVDFAAYWGKGLASWASTLRSSAARRLKNYTHF